MKSLKTKRLGMIALSFLLAAVQTANGQSNAGSIGVDAATAEINQMIGPVSNFILVLGAVVGLIGGVRVYIKWNSGDQDVNKELMGWLGSCIFLVTIGVVIRAFFGVAG